MNESRIVDSPCVDDATPIQQARLLRRQYVMVVKYYGEGRQNALGDIYKESASDKLLLKRKRIRGELISVNNRVINEIINA